MRFIKSLRARLILLVLAAVIPALSVTLYLGLQLRTQARASAESDAIRSVNAITSYQVARLESARQLLLILTNMQEISARDPQTCGQLLKEIQADSTNYNAFTISALDGTIVCSSAELNPAVKISDRDYFQAALATKQIAIGKATIARLTGKPIIPIAAPILDANGSPTGVLTITTNLEELVNLEEFQSLPTHSALLVLDQDGTVLLRIPANENWVGKTLTDAPIIQAILTQNAQGVNELSGLDGVMRVYAFSQIQAGNSTMYTAVGIPSDVIYAEADSKLWSSLLWMGLASALALLAAWFGGDLFFLRVVSLTAERDKAENQLRLANQELEARVEERTASLAKVNERLTIELQERQRAEELAHERAHEAEEGRQTLEALMAFIPEGIAIAEAGSMQPRYISLFGDELISQMGFSGDTKPVGFDWWLNHLRHPDDDQPVGEQENPLYRAITRGEVITDEEWAMAAEDGTRRIFLCNAGPIRAADGQITGGVIGWHDITERKQVNAALQDYAVRLERSNRELQDFAYIASHDLQEPLRKIQAFSERLIRKAGDQLTPEQSDYLDRMTSSASRMQQMINDLLAYSRVSTRGGMLLPIDLSKTICDAITDLEVRIQETGGTVQVEDLPVVEADPVQMRQLFQNLIANALKFHQPDVQPKVRVSGEVHGAGPRPENHKLVICVEDNGIGFDEKYLDRIFMPFQRLHGRTEYEGSGIGLAICRKIVERHGGSLTAESRPGEGARFYITLPLRQPVTQGESQ